MPTISDWQCWQGKSWLWMWAEQEMSAPCVHRQDIVFFPRQIKILSPTVGSVSMTEEREEESKQFVVVPDLRNSSLYHQLYIIVGIVTKEQEFEYFQIIISNYCVKLSLSGESVLEVTMVQCECCEYSVVRRVILTGDVPESCQSLERRDLYISQK